MQPSSAATLSSTFRRQEGVAAQRALLGAWDSFSDEEKLDEEMQAKVDGAAEASPSFLTSALCRALLAASIPVCGQATKSGGEGCCGPSMVVPLTLARLLILFLAEKGVLADITFTKRVRGGA